MTALTQEQIDNERKAAGWTRCRRCSGKGRLTARTELLESTADCGDCDGVGWILPDEIVQRRGGWFVTGVEWSGPWKTEEGAKLARAGRFDEAHALERAA